MDIKDFTAEKLRLAYELHDFISTKLKIFEEKTGVDVSGVSVHMNLVQRIGMKNSHIVMDVTVETTL